MEPECGNMSDCQIGARKGKSNKNNVFIVNGIIHDIMKLRNMKPVREEFKN